MERFKWTDDKVIRFAGYLSQQLKKNPAADIQELLHQWKKSHKTKSHETDSHKSKRLPRDPDGLQYY